MSVRARLLVIAFLLAPGVAGAELSDFRSTIDVAVMYDTPSPKAKKIYVVSRHYPVEVLVTLDHWVRVRDMSGELAWMEASSLGDKRYVVATASGADVRERPDEQAPVMFRAQSGVILELLEPATPGWLRVRHRDGQSGFVRINQVWGG